MREDVCVVLNEREPPKARAAEALVQLLAAKGITASRVEIDRNVTEVLKERSPRLIIIDYLLGDFTTGLDVLESFESQGRETRPQFLFLTDEPSVPVAVQAMRLGAINYLQLENPLSIQNAASDVETALTAPRRGVRAHPPERPDLDDLVAESPASVKLVDEARKLSADPYPVLVIYGPPGSGKSALARAIHAKRKSDSFLREADFDLLDLPLTKLCGDDDIPGLELRLGRNLSLIVDHVNEGDHELLTFLSDRFKRYWSAPFDGNFKGNQSFLTLCTSSKETLLAAKKLLKAPALEIPSLNARKAEIAPFVQRFLAEAGDRLKSKIKPLDAKSILKLSELPWPGELKQLRAVVFEIALSPGLSETLLEGLISSARERWDEENTSDPLALDPLSAYLVLERSGFTMRVAAAKLGCSVNHLRALVESAARGGAK